MMIEASKYSQVIDELARNLDISPSEHRDAVRRYEYVSKCLSEGVYLNSSGEAHAYPQGSFRLGTVVKPIRGGAGANYDIDLVCEIPLAKGQTTPKEVKLLVGCRLRGHSTFNDMLGTEGRRCWTLEYAIQNGVGFHLDVLPAVLDRSSSSSDTAIAITDKTDIGYRWSASNPEGYGKWFDARNLEAFKLVELEQKGAILNRELSIYASIESVPNQLVRTPLQRAIQIMKRHRDIYFNDSKQSEYAPISIIITTVAASLYNNDADVYSALLHIIENMHGYGAPLRDEMVSDLLFEMGLIQKTKEGEWYIGNPVNKEENFADRWHENNHARARAFFSWVGKLKQDLVDIPGRTDQSRLIERLPHALGLPAVVEHVRADRPVQVHVRTKSKPWG